MSKIGVPEEDSGKMTPAIKKETLLRVEARLMERLRIVREHLWKDYPEYRVSVGEPGAQLKEWLEWFRDHAQERIDKVTAFGVHEIPLDSQLNAYLQGQRDAAISVLDKLKQLGKSAVGDCGA